MGTSRLPNLGGGERGIVDCALTLGVYHPQAHGLIQGQAASCLNNSGWGAKAPQPFIMEILHKPHEITQEAIDRCFC
jgi:hypothetical protein